MNAFRADVEAITVDDVTAVLPGKPPRSGAGVVGEPPEQPRSRELAMVSLQASAVLLRVGRPKAESVVDRAAMLRVEHRPKGSPNTHKLSAFGCASKTLQVGNVR